MATTTTTGKIPDDGNWIHGCFIVRIGTEFDTYKKVLEYAQKDEQFGTNQNPEMEANVKKTFAGSGGENDPLPLYYSRRKCRDSSLGGNDAINPLPQFSLDDDISHPHFISDKVGDVQMGQVYSEHIDDLQQILYLGFGIPLFSNVGSFWANATDMELAGFVNKGSGITLEKIGYLIGSAPTRLFNIATIPFKYLGAITNSLKNVPISKYYSFSSQMPMYFRFVNTILVMLATNMNMAGSSDSVPTTGSKTSSTSSVSQVTGGTKPSENLSGMSTVFRDYGLDIARVLTKRYFYENGTNASLKKRYTDEALFESSNLNNGEGTTEGNTSSTTQSTTSVANDTNSQTNLADDATHMFRMWKENFFDNMWAAYKDAIYDFHLFIGFRVDKGMGASESFSNSTGESKISQLANEKLQEGREAAFQTMHGNIGDGALGTVLSGIISGAVGLLKGAASAFNLDPLAAVATGAARINIPEVWMNSSYSRSQSFSITCLAPYGDFESIFQSEYVPLACILAGTLPRGTGFSSHSAPFVCQAYCRGIFSSPLCIIESLEVQRGADQFGMSMARLPLKLTMNLTLKDLSPVMYMSMGGDRGIVNAIFGSDDNFGEYLLTLSGMGLKDRLSPWKSRRRKIQILLSTLFKSKYSPYTLGMEAGNMYLSRVISLIVSAGRGLPGN